jgi:hypothetical protein
MGHFLTLLPIFLFLSQERFSVSPASRGSAIAQNPDYIFGPFTYMLFSMTEASQEEH